jgi:putative sterol carrier protein
VEEIMAPNFPTEEWIKGLGQKLNQDQQYGHIAQNWEGDLVIVIDPMPMSGPLILYFDLWHGKCREAKFIQTLEGMSPAFILTASYENITKILTGDLNPMQAMMIRKLHVQGSMSYMMRNVPTVLDFVRCARETTSDIVL